MPVGAIVVIAGEIVGVGHNRVEELCSPLAHAEMHALQAALAKVGTSASRTQISIARSSRVFSVLVRSCTRAFGGSCSGAVIPGSGPCVRWRPCLTTIGSITVARSWKVSRLTRARNCCAPSFAVSVSRSVATSP